MRLVNLLYRRVVSTKNVNNGAVADIFSELADLLELKGEQSFKVVAYRRAANNIRRLETPVEQLAGTARLLEVPGIGEAIAEKIKEIVETGKLSLLERLRSELDPGLKELVTIPRIGPKTALLLYNKYGIRNRRQFEQGLADGTLVSKGFSSVLAKSIQTALSQIGESSKRMLLIEATDAAYTLLDSLQQANGYDFRVCGSLRRAKDTVGDVDIVALPAVPERKLQSLALELEKMNGSFLAKGESKISWLTPHGVHVDIRLANKENIGAMVLYFTGSKEHNVKLRTLAMKKGLKLNEYGLFKDSDGDLVAGASEEEIYRTLGLQYIEPELREDTGEIERAESGKLPTLVDDGSIQGDLHAHSTWSDGSSTLEEMATAAEKLGYKYLVFTDHSKSESVAHGMTEAVLRRQATAIEKVRSKHPKLEILHGAEVDILREGKLDYDDATLATLDFVVASLHRKFSSDTNLLTEAVVNALENRYLKVLAHPTGRLLGRRGENGIDLDKVLVAARRNGKAVEVNGQPRRMDLPWMWVKRAVEEGVKLALDSDAHTTGELLNMQFAVKNARKGWAGAKDVMNSVPNAAKLLR